MIYSFFTYGLLLIAGCLVFITIFSIVYFSKKRQKNYENKIYQWMLIVNILILIFDFINGYFYVNFPLSVAKAELRIYIMLLLAYIDLMSIYVCVISIKKEEVPMKIKKILIWHLVLFLIGVVCIYTGEIQYQLGHFGLSADGTATSNGMGINIIICFIVWSILVFRNRGNIKKIKYLPFFLYLVFSLLLGSVQLANPGLLLMEPLITVVNTILYFTVENPDMEMINKLTLAKTAAEKASRAKTEFLSSMSHEIRTPLNAVIGFSECIKSAPTLEDAQEDANEIVKASNTLLELVNGIIDFSKIEDGNLEVQEVSYNPRETFTSLAKLVTPKMNEKNLSFSLFISKDVPETLFGDKENIRKIVTNLLTNAYKYTEKGSVEFLINAENKNENCKIRFDIKDTGHGIKEENIEGIFKSFERLEEDKDGVTSGTGLGLAITQQLVETMKGEIKVESKYGEGSTFTVELEQKIEKLADSTMLDSKIELTQQEVTAPIQEQVVSQPESQPVQQPITQETQTVAEPTPVITPTVIVTPTPVVTVQTEQSQNTHQQPQPVEIQPSQQILTVQTQTPGTFTLNLDGKTFLLIDDNVLNLKIASKLLEKMNAHNITTMTNGYELIEKIKSGQKYDVIISDDMMPEISGTETLAELKKIPGFSIPVIVLTANAMAGMREEYLQKGFDEYIAKPINKEILSEILAKILNDPSIIVKNEEKNMSVPEVQQPEPQLASGYDKTYLKNNGVDIDKSLEILGDIKMYNMTMSDFLSSVGPRKDRMIEYKNKNDMKNYAIDVHSLKSDSKYLGFNVLAEICAEHEIKSKENDAKYVWEDFSRLENELNKVLTIANEYATHNNIMQNKPEQMKEILIEQNTPITIIPENNPELKQINKTNQHTLNLESKKIILLDDNEINLKIEKKLLEKMNAKNVEVITSGYELIEKIKNGVKYDLVISDDMMPIISGTETLVELKKIQNFSTPVVVLTANAIDGMREEYLQKGFDEYLAKPVNETRLMKVLEKVLNDPNIIVPANETTQQNDIEKELEDIDDPTSNVSEIKYNKTYLITNGINLKESLQILGDMSTYNMALNDFLGSIESRKNRMIEFKNKNDMKNYAIDVHSLKSDSLYLGFNQLAIIAQEHEIKSKENDTKYICDDYTRIEQELNRVLEIVNNYAKYNNLI